MDLGPCGHHLANQGDFPGKIGGQGNGLRAYPVGADIGPWFFLFGEGDLSKRQCINPRIQDPEDLSRHIEATGFLKRVAQLVGAGGGLLIGVDLRKSRDPLEAAYDDSLGVTAAFNLNILHHINRRLGPVFDAASWKHRALWNADAGRVEMHLVSTRDQEVVIEDRTFRFRAGEAIVTEHSYKYTLDGFRSLADAARSSADRASHGEPHLAATLRSWNRRHTQQLR